VWIESIDVSVTSVGTIFIDVRMACGSFGGGINTEGRWLWTGLEPIREREVAGVVSGSASQWVGGRHK
jgi:hypothetical protein